MIMTNEKLWSVVEAAEFLELTDVRVRQFCRQGRLGTKVGGTYIIKDSELREFASEERKTGRPKNSEKTD